jgi:hypothetical protein
MPNDPERSEDSVLRTGGYRAMRPIVRDAAPRGDVRLRERMERYAVAARRWRQVRIPALGVTAQALRSRLGRSEPMAVDPTLLAIWWLREPALRQLVADGEETRDLWRLLGVPEYVGAELDSAFGRAGRGRLWPAAGIACDDLAWDDAHPNAVYCGQAAGIVFWRRDAPRLAGLPGLLTDCALATLDLLEEAHER